MRRTTPLPIPLPDLPIRRWIGRVRRSPFTWWTLALVAAVLAVSRIGAAADAADARRRSWGESVEVVVAVRPLQPGDVVSSGDTRLEHWPAAVVPAGALHEPPTGAVVVAALVAGEAVVEQRLAPDGLSGVAALIPPGHRAVAVPVAGGGYGTEAPPLARGDRVDVLATFEVLDADLGDDPPAGPVAQAALVVDVGDAAITVAVAEADASRVAFAVARGTVTLALVGAG